MSRALGPFEECFTQGTGHATDLVREGLARGIERIITVGGDGTNNEAVNGFFDGARPIRPGAELGFIPRGTGGDFRKTLGLAKDLPGCLAALTAGRTRLADLGMARFQDSKGRDRTRLFINITSFGLGGLVDAYVNKSTKALGGKASFMIGTLRAVLVYHNKTIRLKVDDRPEETLRVTNVAVANGQYFGGGMWVAPHASIDDGLFDVIIMGDFSKGEVIRKSGAIYKGLHLKDPKVRELRGAHVEATSDEEVLIDMDGEQPGRLPITLDLLPKALNLIVP
jgi:YegS/Rv2252/BmrU family lipid kinase